MAVVAIVDKVPHVCMYVTMKKEATHPLCAVCHIFNFNAKGAANLCYSVQGPSNYQALAGKETVVNTDLLELPCVMKRLVHKCHCSSLI